MPWLFDVTATKDWANCEARADVTVDGWVLVSAVPVSCLLFLEKRLTDIYAFVHPGLFNGRRINQVVSHRDRGPTTPPAPLPPGSGGPGHAGRSVFPIFPKPSCATPGARGVSRIR